MSNKRINPLIWDELERITDENVREFLRELLLFEREHISEDRPRYSEEYDRLIEKYSKKMKGETE